MENNSGNGTTSSYLDSPIPPEITRDALTTSEGSENGIGDHEPSSPPAESSFSSTETSLSHEPSPREEVDAPPPLAGFDRSVKLGPPVVVTKTVDGVKTFGRRSVPSLSIVRRIKREEMVKKGALGFRVFASVFCLASLSVMAADRRQGWALDSFYRYKEFRYCISVNVMGFVYSGAQAFNLAYVLATVATGNYAVQQQFRCYFDFAMDQIITYLLMSASSSAATRVDDWKSNWGKDKFPDMATVSVSMSFLAFAALSFSSLISGYALCKLYTM